MHKKSLLSTRIGDKGRGFIWEIRIVDFLERKWVENVGSRRSHVAMYIVPDMGSHECGKCIRERCVVYKFYLGV